MIVIVLCVIAGVSVAIATTTFGFVLGRHTALTEDRLERLEARREAEDDSSAIVDTSPKKIRERHQFAGMDSVSREPEDDDDSAIVHVKSPKQMRADKERREQAELDKITRGAIR